MAGPKLSVDLLARVSNWIKGLGQAKKATVETEQATKNLIKTTNQFNARVGKSRSLHQMSAAFQKTGRNSAEASASVIEFSRALQDAPYGIQGVANNIQQLSANFANLVKKTGSTSEALKAFGTGLISGGGSLVIAVTLITLLIQKWDVIMKAFGKTALTTAEQIKVLEKKMADFAATLTLVEKAQLDGQQGSAEQITNLKLLRQQIEDTTLSTELRLDGVKRLRSEFPGYFKDVSDEALLNGDLAKTYNDVTESILKRARATAATQAIIENTKKELALLFEQEKVEKKLSDTRIKVAQADKAVAVQTQTGLNTNIKSYKDLNIAVGEQNDLLRRQQEILKETRDIFQQNQKLNTIIQANTTIVPDKPEIEKQVKNFYLAYSKGFATIPSGAFDITPGALTKLEDFTAQYGKAMRNLRKENLKTIQAVEVFKSKLEEIFDNLELALAKKVSGGIANILSDLGDSIGQALVNGGNLIAIGAASLISSFGSFISDIGKLLIEYGTLAVAKGTLDTALSTLFGPALIGAGLAAIGIGVALSAIGGAFKTVGQKGLSEGGVQGGISGSGSFSGANSYSGGGGGYGGGEVVFRIQGSSLVGVLNNTLNSNSRLGGTLTIGNG